MTQTTRLLKLARLLERNAANRKAKKKAIRFDLRNWGNPTNLYAWVELSDKGKILKVNCKTTACACGLACLSKTFQNEGLDYRLGDDGTLTPLYGRRRAQEAIRHFFGISDGQMKWLFFPENYKGWKTYVRLAGGSKNFGDEIEVATRIRKFVEDGVSPR